MKNLILLITLLLSYSAFSRECANWISLEQYNFGVVNNGGVVTGCEKGDNECICFDNMTEWKTSELVDVYVDDLSKPILEVGKVNTCKLKIDEDKLPKQDPKMEAEEWAALYEEAMRKLTAEAHEDCQKEIDKLQCEEGFNKKVEFEDETYSYYCQKLLGYEQKFGYREARPNPEKERKFKEEQAKLASDKAAEAYVEKLENCGKSVKRLLIIRNASKNLTKAEVKQMHEMYKDIDMYLAGPSLGTAAEEMQKAVPDGRLLTEEDKVAMLTKLQECSK